MSANDALLFIDANKYLDLYRTDKGKKLLAPLGEQVDHIFVTKQVVSEVQRNKILVAAEFLRQKFKALKLQTINVPDHLSGEDSSQGKKILEKMRQISLNIKQLNADVDALMFGIIEQISQSEDEVSKTLSPIFANALISSSDELKRARDRRELGNPPGKSNNPIGDQLTWEQILTHFRGRKRLWIISRDGDYGTVFGGKGFLNRFLYNELCEIASEPEVYLFEDLVKGIRHFVDTTGVKAENRLTPEEVEEIEIEERSLPHLSLFNQAMDRTIAEATKIAQQNEMIFQPKISETIMEAAKIAQQNEMLFQPKVSETIAELVRITQQNQTFSQPKISETIFELLRIAQQNETKISETIIEAAKMAQGEKTSIVSPSLNKRSQKTKKTKKVKNDE